MKRLILITLSFLWTQATLAASETIVDGDYVAGAIARNAVVWDVRAADAYAKGHGQTAALARLQENVEQMVKQMEAAQKTKSIRLMLADQNEPAQVSSGHQKFYYRLLAFGDQKEQPGAELNAGWYQRNAKIFAKLVQIARPGDRVLVAFGAGHAFWLRHFVQSTPGFELVEPNLYLR